MSLRVAVHHLCLSKWSCNHRHSVFTELSESFSKFKCEGVVGSSKFIASWLEVRVTSKTCWWCLEWGQSCEGFCPSFVGSALCVGIVRIKCHCRIPSWHQRINVSTILPAFMERYLSYLTKSFRKLILKIHTPAIFYGWGNCDLNILVSCFKSVLVSMSWH